MPILRSQGKLILFVHIPKTGGSSVEDYLRCKGKMCFYTAKRPPEGLAVTPQHFHRTVLDALFDNSFFDARFAVLRDPMSRLMSEYRWRSGKKRGTATRAPNLAQSALRKISPGLGYRALDFDNWVHETMQAYAKDPWIYDNHIRPQADFVREGDRLFALENGLEPVFRWIDKITGTTAESGSFWSKRSSGERLMISQKTTDRVRQFYARDYALLAELKTES